MKHLLVLTIIALNLLLVSYRSKPETMKAVGTTPFAEKVQNMITDLFYARLAQMEDICFEWLGDQDAIYAVTCDMEVNGHTVIYAKLRPELDVKRTDTPQKMIQFFRDYLQEEVSPDMDPIAFYEYGEAVESWAVCFYKVKGYPVWDYLMGVEADGSVGIWVFQQYNLAEDRTAIPYADIMYQIFGIDSSDAIQTMEIYTSQSSEAEHRILSSEDEIREVYGLFSREEYTSPAMQYEDHFGYGEQRDAARCFIDFHLLDGAIVRQVQYDAVYGSFRYGTSGWPSVLSEDEVKRLTQILLPNLVSQ